MIKLDKVDALALHAMLADETGGSVGIRDENLLESALNGAFATFAGQELYPTIEEKGARIGFSLISNHAFVDGNKRIGLLVMLTFLEVNGCILKLTDDELIRVGLAVASGELKYGDLLEWITSRRIGDLSERN